MNRSEDASEVRDASCYGRQGVLTKREVFKWSVQASLVQRGEARSDMFTFGPARNSKFCLVLAMDPDKSEYLHNQFGVCLYRRRTSVVNTAEDIAVKVSIALLDTRDRLHYPCERVMRDSDRVYATFDCSIFDKHQQIFFRKGMLCIHCSMDVEEILSEDAQDSREPMGASHDVSRDLVEDLAALLENEKFCDVSLCTGDRVFQAHRSILGARSPVFAAMFEHETLEKMQNRVNIQDVDGDVMRHLLRYVYTGSAGDVSPAVCLSLLAAADKYSLPHLKKMCSSYLCSNLTADVALSVLTVANLHQDEDLREAAIEMILNNAIQVMKTDDWLTFLRDYSELANSVILRLAAQK